MYPVSTIAILTLVIFIFWRLVEGIDYILQSLTRDVGILLFLHTAFAQNWMSYAELTKQRRNFKILQILFSVIARSLALTAATDSAKHFGVKVIKYFIVLCINAAVELQESQFQIVTNKFLSYTRSVTSLVSWHQKRQRLLSWPPVGNNTKK